MASVQQHVDLVSEANKITKRKTIYAAGAGLIPFPILDAATLMAIQLTMIRSIGNLYGVPFKEDLVKPLVGSLAGSFGSVGMIKSVPGLGTVLGSTATVLSGAAVTYALGRVFTNHFDQGGTLLGFDPVNSRAYFLKEFKAGRMFLSRQDLPTLEGETQDKSEESFLLKENRKLRIAIVDLEVEIEYLQQKLKEPETDSSSEVVVKVVASGQTSSKNKKSKQIVKDFTLIEGIGPQINKILIKAGISSMDALAKTKVNTLRKILKDAGGKFNLADPESWPEQAALAASGKMEALAILQEKLTGGRDKS